MVMHNARINDNIFTYGDQPIFTREGDAAVIKHSSFDILSTETSVWTPSAAKSIYLTAVQTSAPLGVTVMLSSNSNSFLSLRVTTSSSAISQQFPSGYLLSPGNSIDLRTSDEESASETSGASNAAQVAFNGNSNFTNVSNATGLPDSLYATLNSALLATTGGRIVLDYSNMVPAASSQLQIQSVVINFYCSLSLTLAVGTSSMIYYWRADPGDAWIQLAQESLSLVGTINHLIVPLSQDITAAVLAAADPWTVIENMQTSFVGSNTGLGLGNTIQLDAVTIDISMVGINEITLFGSEM
jgi:hypothetical protein